MDAVPGVPGAAGLVLAGNVVPLDPEPAVLAAMLEGWGRQQRARFLQDRTIAARARWVRRLAEFSGQYPWQWNAAEIEAFFGSLRCGGRPAAASTARGLSGDAAAVPGLPHRCPLRVGRGVRAAVRRRAVPGAGCVEHGGAPAGLRGTAGAAAPLTYDEVQALLDAADGLVGQIRERGRKGELTARRDAALLKCVYAFGLRGGRRAAWTWPTCGVTRRLRRSAGTGRCSCGGASPRPGARPSGAPCCWSRRWTGSESRSWPSGRMRSARCWCPARTRRCSSPSGGRGSGCGALTWRSAGPAPRPGCRASWTYTA